MIKNIIAAAALMTATGAYADNFSWQPSIHDQFHVGAGQVFNVAGSAIVTIENTTDQPHTYNYYLGVGTDCGNNNGNGGEYQTNITIAPHSTWTENRTVAGYTKCNMPGTRKMQLLFSLFQGNNMVFSKTQMGWFFVG